jgi:hypothetical protein
VPRQGFRQNIHAWAGCYTKVWVRVEIMGSQKYENVGESQSLPIMNDPIIFTRTRRQRESTHRGHGGVLPHHPLPQPRIEREQPRPGAFCACVSERACQSVCVFAPRIVGGSPGQEFCGFAATPVQTGGTQRSDAPIGLRQLLERDAGPASHHELHLLEALIEAPWIPTALTAAGKWRARRLNEVAV